MDRLGHRTQGTGPDPGYTEKEVPGKGHTARALVNLVNRQGVPGKGTSVLCAVSGGADSVALLLFLQEFRDYFGFSRLAACHVHHGIRGKEADDDAAFVKDLCAKLKIPLYLYRGCAKERQGERGLENAARELRYGALADAAEYGGYACLAVAHHRRDQAETVLMHLLRGSGLSGLGGMRPLEKRALAKTPDRIREAYYPEAPSPKGSGRPALTLWRPFLGCSPQLLRDYLESRGQGYRTDSTNLDLGNPRNAVRCRLLPEAEKIYPGAEEALLRAAERIRTEDAYLEQEAGEWFRSLSAGRGKLRAETLPPALEARVLQKFCRENGLGQVLTAAHLEQLAGIFRKGNGECFLPDGLRARMEEGILHLAAAPGGKKPPAPEIRLRIPGKTQIPGGWILAERSCRAPGKLPPQILLLDREAWGEPLRVRTWKEGDRMQPFGMEGTKLVSDILTDRHVPHRGDVQVLLAGDTILWIPGVLASEGTRIGTGHGELIEIKFLSEGEKDIWKK